MAHVPEPEHVNILISSGHWIAKNLDAIITGVVVVLLAVLKLLGRRDVIETTEAVLKERPVSHAELLKCQMKVNTTINNNFEKLRHELMEEVSKLHEKFNTHIRTNARKSTGE